jgi:hypothetical protein
MKLTLTILISLFFSVSYSQTSNLSKIEAQKINCEIFLNGTFKIPGDSISPETILVRNGKYQKETTDKVEGYSEFIVNWIDNCTYTLTPTEITFKRFPGLPKNALLTVQIIEIKDNSYVQISSANFSEMKMTSEVFKIE